MKKSIRAILLALPLALAAASCTDHPSASPDGTPQTAQAATHLYGVLGADPRWLKSDFDAGMRVRHLSMNWKQYEPQQGVWNEAYLKAKRDEYQQMKAAGFAVVLGLGVQHPPAWVLEYPNGRFVNQYGDTFASTQSGVNPSNAVFNQAVRERQALYIRRLFSRLGTDFFAVRLGGGTFGELNYPDPRFNGRTNGYWAYDAIAQGRAGGAPPGIRPSPVPGWRPGEPSADHRAAADFIDWYMGSLQNYHDWQIATVRSVYSGTLFMLYPSWGVRPGQLDLAIRADLNGTTSAERNNEVQRGFDFARYIAGITDPRVVPYTTWLDAPHGNDASSNPVDWTPGHYLASRAAAHPLRLAVWGENTGRNDVEAMRRCFARMQAYGLGGIFWAFEQDLYSGNPNYASIRDYAALIAQNP